MTVIYIQRDPLRAATVHYQQQRDGDPRAQRGHEQVERLGRRSHLEGRLGVKELQRRDTSKDLAYSNQHKLRDLQPDVL